MRTNHALWIAPLLGGVGLLSYFTVFAQWPVTRDFPFVNLALVAIGAALGVLGGVRAWRRGGWRIPVGLASAAVSLATAGMLTGYVFILSYQLPGEDRALSLGAPVPAIELLDTDERPIDLAKQGRSLLVFYRGHW